MDMVSFDKHSARPPVHPGRETSSSSTSSSSAHPHHSHPHSVSSASFDPQTCSSTTSYSEPSTPVSARAAGAGMVSSSSSTSTMRAAALPPPPPVPLPRRGIAEREQLPDGFAPLGFEPEGGSDHLPGGGEALSTSPPNYLEWAKNFNTLLNDPDGLHLFRKYLAAENQSDLLEFWFACEGLKKQTSEDQINLIVKCIYRRFFKDSRLGLHEEVFSSVLEEIRNSSRNNCNLSSEIFAESQVEVERIINDIVYRNFLQSDIYLNYIHHMTQDGGVESASECTSSTSGSGGSSSHEPPPPQTLHYPASSCSSTPMTSQPYHPHPHHTAHSHSHHHHPSSNAAATSATIQSETLSSLTDANATFLPTLHEDAEFLDEPKKALPVGPRLTKDSLMATVKKRTLIIRPKPESFAGVFLKPTRPNPYALAYNSYNPVSRHDSDIQSLSSDARSGSDLSINTSLGGNNTLNRPKHERNSCPSNEHQQHPPKARAILNKEENLHNTIIPRTMLKSKVPNMNPQEFANILISKLSIVKRDQDTDERLLQSLNEVPTGGSTGLSDALSERFPNCIEDDQDILDQHIESVFDKIGLSPGFTTPHRPKSPETGGGSSALPPRIPNKPPPLLPKVAMPPPPPLPFHPAPMSRLDYLRHKTHHRDRDGTFSIFTSDSGNVQDLTDGTETLLSYGNNLPKSRSMPDYAMSSGDPSSCSRQGSRRYMAKRSDSQIFDSGISGISCSTNATPAPAIVQTEQPEYLKNRNVAQWLLESSSSSTVMDKETLSNVTTSTRLRHTITVKHKPGSRSCSSERPGSSTSVKMHPYVIDPSMPPLPSPHIPTQLEEVSRRLLEKDTRPIQARFKNMSAGVKQPPDSSNLSTLRSSGCGRPSSTPTPALAEPANFTTVVFTFCDEQYPYRTKIPCKPVTLKQFKDYLPKKGSYRFFFKTECDDVDTKVIQEEIVDDNEVLPLWEGKVMGQVKPLETESMGNY